MIPYVLIGLAAVSPLVVAVQDAAKPARASDLLRSKYSALTPAQKPVRDPAAVQPRVAPLRNDYGALKLAQKAAPAPQKKPAPSDPSLSWQLYRLGGDGGALAKSVNLDLDNATIADGLKALFDQIQQPFELDKDTPADVRVTLHVKNVRAGTALDLLTQAAGIQAARESRDGKTVYHLGKAVRASTPWKLDTLKGNTDVPFTLQNLAQPAIADYSGKYTFREERSTFTCPYCKKQTTVLRQRESVKCPTCSRVFQDDWKFCPVDGTKRPPTPGAWKFCPNCGKAVESEKGSGEASKESSAAAYRDAVINTFKRR